MLSCVICMISAAGVSVHKLNWNTPVEIVVEETDRQPRVDMQSHVAVGV